MKQQAPPFAAPKSGGASRRPLGLLFHNYFAWIYVGIYTGQNLRNMVTPGATELMGRRHVYNCFFVDVLVYFSMS